MIMWPVCVITEKLMKVMEGGGGGGGGGDRDEEPTTSNDPVPRRRFSVDVPHVRQRFNWDCGIACVLMVLRALGFDQYKIDDLEKLCCTTSIWTIDLAYLLHKFSVACTFFTVTLGANPEYSAQSYYSEQLEDDRGRINGLFEKAHEAGIDIQCRSISGEDISSLMLSGKHVAVALVDKIKLSQSWPEDLHLAESCGRSSDYIGHYVVICGYNADSKEFDIRDPASPRKYQRISTGNLDDARRSFGTDEDILLISLMGKNAVHSQTISYNDRGICLLETLTGLWKICTRSVEVEHGGRLLSWRGRGVEG